MLYAGNVVNIELMASVGSEKNQRTNVDFLYLHMGREERNTIFIIAYFRVAKFRLQSAIKRSVF